MPAPVNVSAATAQILDWGDFVQDVSGAAGPNYEVWFKYVGKTGDLVLGALALVPLASNYDPSMTVYSGPVDALVSVLAAAPHQAAYFQVTPGATYYFKVRHAAGLGSPPDAPLTMSLRQPPATSPIPAGSILIPDASLGWPMAAIDGTVGGILGYIDLPPGESGIALPDGTTMLEDSLRNHNIGIYDASLTRIASVAIDLNGQGQITSNGLDKFYVGSENPPLSNATVMRVSKTGTVERTYTLPSTGLNGIGVSPDETILYFRQGASSTNNRPIGRWDLINDVALSDLAPGQGASVAGSLWIQVLEDGSVLVPYKPLGAPTYIIRYSAAGAILNTYTRSLITVKTLDRFVLDLDPGQFWLWEQTTDTHFFTKMRASDGAELLVLTAPSFQDGKSLAAASDDPTRFGASDSCPMIMSRTPITIAAPPAPIPPDGTNPCCADPTPNPPPPSGTPPPGNPGNAPPPNPYVPLPPWVASCDGGGTVPQAADETDPESWWAA